MSVFNRLKKHINRVVVRVGLLFAVPIGLFRLMGYVRGGKFCLILTHSWGGGSESFLRNEILGVGDDVLVVRGGGVSVEVEGYRGGQRLWRCRVSSVRPFLSLMFAIVSSGDLRKIFINHLVEFKRLSFVMRRVLRIGKRSAECELIYFMHDHYSVCPSMFLLSSEDKFCGVPDRESCEGCAAAQGLRFRAGSNMHQWRLVWRRFLLGCDRIVCFSNASKEIVLKAYGKDVEAKIQIVPHKIDSTLTKRLSIARSAGRVRVGILGNLSRHKGLGFVSSLAREAQVNGRNIDFVVIGTILEEFAHPMVKVYGKYELDQLPLLARLMGVDVFLIPSIVPETFSYATAEVMALGYPLVVLNLGAPGERVRSYCYGKVLAYELMGNAGMALDEILAWYRGDVAAQARRLNSELSVYDLRDVADAYFGF